MLRMNLSKDDYVMIGDNIRVNYEKNTGSGSFSISISAPRDIKILRKSLYEDEIESEAAKGDAKSQILTELLREEYEERRRISEHRRAKQQFHRERLLKQKKETGL